MTSNVKRPETVELVRKLAELLGEGLTKQVHNVLVEAFERAAVEAEQLKAIEKIKKVEKITAAAATIQAHVNATMGALGSVYLRPWKRFLLIEDDLQ